MIVKEVVFADEEKVRIQHNGLVLQRYDEDLEWFYYKIVADVAVVSYKDSDGCPVVYGAADADDGDGTEVYETINKIVGDFMDGTVRVEIVDDNFRLPEGETIFSPSIIDGEFSSWALVMYGGQAGSVLYVKYNEFDETSYNEVTSILSKMYTISEYED